MPQLALATQSDACADLAADEDGAGFREHRLTAQDGRSLYAREYGPVTGGAVPVLCLPGLTRNHRDFHRLAQRLARDRRVVCPDMRGRGRSDWDPSPRNYRPEVLLLDVIHIITAFRLHPCVLIGTSLGGLLSMGVAVVEPRTVAGIVLNDSSPGSDPQSLHDIARYVDEYKVQPNWDAAARYARELIGRDWSWDDATWLRLARQTYSKGRDGMLHLDYDREIAWPLRQLLAGSGPRRDLWTLFKALKRIPAVAVRGALSNVLSEATFERMTVEKPDLVTVTVPGVGHAPLLEEAEVRHAIDELLARV